MKKLVAIGLGTVFLSLAISSASRAVEIQLTFDADRNHQLDNNLNFSPDDQWLAYDTRAFSGGIRNTLTLEKVNVNTQQIVVIRSATNPITDKGPGMGAVSYFPNSDTVIAIHGPETSTGLTYEGYRRYGAMFSPTDGTASLVAADARDVTFPLTPGAMRGGTHRHEPSGDGQWVGFTYNDQIMAGLGKDLRTIGIMKLNSPVDVDEDPLGENHDGTAFSVLLVKVKPQNEVLPDTEEISQASDDSFVGDNGYLTPGGTMQRARAFVGRTRRTLPNGTVVNRNELFVVDIPTDITVPGPDGPLEGTATTFPMPPAGTVQRMLTMSDSDVGEIVRSSKDGSRIAFSKVAPNGERQIFLTSPLGGDPVQATFLPGGSYKPWWHPSGDYLLSIANNSIWGTNVIPGDPNFGQSWMITQPTPAAPPDALVVSHSGNLIAFNRQLDMGRSDGRKVNQIFVVDFFVPEPSALILVGIGLCGLAGRMRRRSC